MIFVVILFPSVLFVVITIDIIYHYHYIYCYQYHHCHYHHQCSFYSPLPFPCFFASTVPPFLFLPLPHSFILFLSPSTYFPFPLLSLFFFSPSHSSLLFRIFTFPSILSALSPFPLPLFPTPVSVLHISVPLSTLPSLSSFHPSNPPLLPSPLPFTTTLSISLRIFSLLFFPPLLSPLPSSSSPLPSSSSPFPTLLSPLSPSPSQPSFSFFS